MLFTLSQWEIGKFKGVQRQSVRKEFWIIQQRRESVFTVDSPCFGANVVSIHVIHQAVFVAAQGLVPPVHKHAAAGLVVHAAVAVTSLDHRASGGHNQPGVCPWKTARCPDYCCKTCKKMWVLWLLLWGETKQQTPGGEKWGKRDSPEDITVHWI